MVEVKQLVNDAVSGVKIVEDLARGERIAVDPLSASKTTYALSPSAIAHKRQKQQCAGGPESEQMSIAGLDAVRSTREIRPNAQIDHEAAGVTIVTDEWRAHNLNCEVLNAISKKVDPEGAVLAKNTTETLSIRLGEPDPTLFEVPGSYTERSPSEVLNLSYQREGRDQLCETCARTHSVLDQAYFESREAAQQ